MWTIRRSLGLLTVVLLAACGGDGPSGAAPTPPPTLDPDRLLTDAELRTAADPNAPDANQAWIDWATANAVPIRSLVSSRFDDLRFLGPLLQNKRLVQLGESGHGVREFDEVKVRLIKFLHEELGYDVIAFESGLFDCWDADRLSAQLSSRELMRHCIFGVWHTEEVLALFDYIKQTKTTSRPLTLAGFDVQLSGTSAPARPEFFQGVLSADPSYADQVRRFDATFIARARSTQALLAQFLADSGTIYSKRYADLAAYIERNSATLTASTTEKKLARQAALSQVAFIKELQAPSGSIELTEARDEGMADNVTFLLRELYPDKKIIAWAHNFHIRYDNVNTDVSKALTMGKWIAERHRAETYTVGLFMYRGAAATNNRVVYPIGTPPAGSLESILYRVRKHFLFVDLAGHARQPGTTWMFEPLIAREWGVNSMRMVLRDQYDGVLFIDTTDAPRYIVF